jgi:hypothetical protein
MAYKDDAAKEGSDAIKTVLQQTNPLGVPTAIKAPLEIAMNRSLYTGQDIKEPAPTTIRTRSALL